LKDELLGDDDEISSEEPKNSCLIAEIPGDEWDRLRGVGILLVVVELARNDPDQLSQYWPPIAVGPP